MIRLLTGENSYALRRRLKDIVSSYESKNPDGEVLQADASDIEPDELNGLLSNASLFSQDSLVILKNIDDKKEIAERLPDMLDSLSDGTDLVLVSAKPDKRTRWYKTAQKKAETETFGELSESQLAGWCVKRANELGAELKPADAHLLVSRTGLNQSKAGNELDKLAAYNKAITRENIELLVDKTLEESVFDLIDAVVKGRTKHAQTMYSRLLKIDIDAYKFIGLLSWQLHNLLVVKANDKMPAGRLASQAGAAPFVINKTRRLASNLTLHQIKKMIGLALKADADIKQTRADVDSRIELLIDEIGLATALRS